MSDNRNKKKNINSDYFDDGSNQVIKNSSQKRKKKKKTRLGLMLMINLLLLSVLCGILFFTAPGQKAIINLVGDYIYDKLDYQTDESGNDDSETVNTKNVNLKPVMNFLLIGVEEIKGARNTDSLMIATMNTKTKSLKLTSIMRDLYVDIPGYSKNRINSVYSKGGIDLLYETIKLNFGIEIDGYCMVNFEAFEQIVDIIGGIEITLTEKEAEYLRKTNYISKKENRKVVAGKQLMNGNQVLGYCRVRKVSTGTENNDFGRTQRHRIVLQAIYDKLKSKNIVSLVRIMNKILNEVEIKTDISNKTFKYCLEQAVSFKVKDIQTLRIPKDGTYENATVKIGSRKAAVLMAKDWEATREYIYDFIYGTDEEN